MNDQLISIDDDSLDTVAGGGWTFSVTVPTIGEVVDAAGNAVEDVVGGLVKGANDLLDLFNVSVS